MVTKKKLTKKKNRECTFEEEKGPRTPWGEGARAEKVRRESGSE